jgi:hypothetical protein
MKRGLLYLFIGLTAFNAQSDIEVLSPLQFGIIAILDNSNVETYSISASGVERTSANILVVSQGSPATFRVFNLQANTPIVVTRQILSNELQSNQLNTDTLDFVQVSSSILLNTDDSGEVTFNVGGALATKGDSSINYGSSELNGTFSITIDF